jgi:hypothetical protein
MFSTLGLGLSLSQIGHGRSTQYFKFWDLIRRTKDRVINLQEFADAAESKYWEVNKDAGWVWAHKSQPRILP